MCTPFGNTWAGLADPTHSLTHSPGACVQIMWFVVAVQSASACVDMFETVFKLSK